MDHLIDTIKLWNVETKTEIATLHSSGVHSVAFNTNGSGSYDRTIKLWNVETKTEIHSNWVNSVAFNTNGTILASGSDDRTIKLWNVETKTEIATLKGHSYSC